MIVNFMIRHLVILLVTFYWSNALGQPVIVGKQPREVPQGKKWTLTTKMQPVIELNEGTLNSGTLCNAMILSNSKNVTGIIEGGYYGKMNKGYGINFTGLSEVAYTNARTYKISSIENFSCVDYHKKNDQHSLAITFYPGQVIYVMGCLESIQMFQTTFTQNDVDELKRKEALEKQNSIKEEQIREEKQREIELQEKNSITTSPKIVIGASQCDKLKIGDTYVGGIVFYFTDSIDCHGLVCAPSDQSANIKWNDAVTLCNSLKLKGYSDWRLPSKDELNQIYTNLQEFGLGGFANYCYWSSSGGSNDCAWFQDFRLGNQGLGLKYFSSHYLRVVRVF